MFGLLRPSSNGLRCSEKREFNTFYCGLCKGLDHHHGTLTRGLLSFDGVFVALLADALVDEARAAQPDRCRCPLLPVVHRPTVRPDSVAMTFAASVQMLLFDQWAADGATEGKLGRGLVRGLSLPHATRAHERLDALGVSLRALEDFDRVQAGVESARDASPVTAAAPTANALRLVFGRIAALPGGCTDAETALGELGAAIGNAIYWIDALEDLDGDVRSGNFNPCVVAGRRSAKRVRTTARLLRADIARLPRLLADLPLARHRRVLEDIATGLATRATSAIEGAEPAPNVIARSRGFAVALALFVWAWLCAVPRAFAKGEPEPNRSTNAGTPTATLKNEGDITHYDDEVAFNDAAGLVVKDKTIAKTGTPDGKVVAVLAGGTALQVHASRGNARLVRFPDPKDRSASLYGWVPADAIVAPAAAPAPPPPPPSAAPSSSAPPPVASSSAPKSEKPPETAKPEPTKPGSGTPSWPSCGCSDFFSNMCDALCKPCKSCCSDSKSCCDCCQGKDCGKCCDCKACGDCGNCCGDCGKCCGK